MAELKPYLIEFLKVIGDPTRLDILDYLQKEERNANEIQKTLRKSQSTISQHLKILISTNLVDNYTEKHEKKYITYYKIKNEKVFDLLAKLNSFVLELNREKLRDLRDLDVRDTLL